MTLTLATVKAGELDNCSSYWQRQLDNAERGTESWRAPSTAITSFKLAINKRISIREGTEKAGSCCRQVLFSFVTHGQSTLSGHHHLTTSSFSTTHHFHFIKVDSSNFSALENSTTTKASLWLLQVTTDAADAGQGRTLTGIFGDKLVRAVVITAQLHHFQILSSDLLVASDYSSSSNIFCVSLSEQNDDIRRHVFVSQPVFAIDNNKWTQTVCLLGETGELNQITFYQCGVDETN